MRLLCWCCFYYFKYDPGKTNEFIHQNSGNQFSGSCKGLDIQARESGWKSI